MWVRNSDSTDQGHSRQALHSPAWCLSRWLSGGGRSAATAILHWVASLVSHHLLSGPLLPVWPLHMVCWSRGAGLPWKQPGSPRVPKQQLPGALRWRLGTYMASHLLHSAAGSKSWAQPRGSRPHRHRSSEVRFTGSHQSDWLPQ